MPKSVANHTKKILTCPICKKEFKKLNGNQKYCSEVCFLKNKRIKDKVRGKEWRNIHLKKEPQPTNCLYCSKQFQPRRSNQFACLDKKCKNIRHRIRYAKDKERFTAYYLKNKDEILQCAKLFSAFSLLTNLIFSDNLVFKNGHLICTL